LQDQKRELSEKMLRLRGTDSERAVGMPMPLKFSARELLPLQFFGGIGSTTVPKSFKIHDRVSWNSEAGRVSGTVIRVHTRDFDHSGYTHHASPGDPQYEIKSANTDHIAFHRGLRAHQACRSTSPGQAARDDRNDRLTSTGSHERRDCQCVALRT
jgi:hypothetical protein